MMPIIKKFVHEGEEYEIRCWSFNNNYQAAIYRNGKNIYDNFAPIHSAVANDMAYQGKSLLDLTFQFLEEEVKSGRVHP